jgi:predicted SnoaL-like aldol condensation-catalyzing enzyme
MTAKPRILNAVGANLKTHSEQLTMNSIFRTLLTAIAEHWDPATKQ